MIKLKPLYNKINSHPDENDDNEFNSDEWESYLNNDDSEVLDSEDYLDEIKVSRPYKLTLKGQELLIDIKQLAIICDKYYKINKMTPNGTNWRNIYGGYEECDEQHEIVYLQVGFDNKLVTTPDLFVENLLAEGIEEDKNDALQKFNNFIKKGYIQ